MELRFPTPISFLLLLNNTIYKKFYNLEMQKSELFQSFLQKKQKISRMISENKSPPGRQHFKHFEAVSEPTYIRAESNAMYLAHMNGEFKNHLRQFVHEQQGFHQTMSQLTNISENIESQRNKLQKQYRRLRTILNEAELQKQVCNDKNDCHLDKILAIKQANKSAEIRAQEYEKIATDFQENVEYQNCVLAEIKCKNSQLVQKLQIKAVQIQFETSKMQTKQKQMRTKGSELKNINQNIESIYFTLQAQDNTLTTLCDCIQSGLNKQNEQINEFQSAKNSLASVLTEIQRRKVQLQQVSEVQQSLLNSSQDLCYEIRRVQKQAQIQQKGIDEEYWRIQKQTQRLYQNQQMLAQIRGYLADLVHKNQKLEQTLEEQIIQDHTIKKIVQSKCSQPVGMKTKIFLREYEQKQMAQTSSSFKQNTRNSAQKKSTDQSRLFDSKKNSNSSLLSNLDFQLSMKQKVLKKVPQQMQFIFEKFERQNRMSDISGQQFPLDEDVKFNTGFTYIHGLSKLEA